MNEDEDDINDIDEEPQGGYPAGIPDRNVRWGVALRRLEERFSRLPFTR